MMLSDDNTMKTGDWGYESMAAMAISHSRSCRNSDVKHLMNLLPLRQQELDAEQQKASPNMVRVAILRRIVNNLQHTINSVQR